MNARWLAAGGVLAYAGAFHYAWVYKIWPLFEYAHYTYTPPSMPECALSYALILAPLLTYRPSTAPAHYGTSLIYALCYAPAQLIVAFMWERSSAELVTLQAGLAVSMTALIAVSARGWSERRNLGVDDSTRQKRASPISLGIVRFMLAATAAVMLVLIVGYHDHMRLVSFADVYDLRSDTLGEQKGAVFDYSAMWLSSCCIPFFFALGICRRKASDIAIALLGCLLLYAAFGAKSAALMAVMVFGVDALLQRWPMGFLPMLLATFAVITAAIDAFSPDDGIGLWITAIVLMRTFAVGGWSMSLYYDFFSHNGFTHYTHIGPVKAIFGGYPYGNLDLGRVIGLEYADSTEANFNANFWASDGFAALGLWGLPVVTVALAFVLVAINVVARGYSSRFVTLWLIGFWLVLLNAPLSTSLLSGSGLIIMFLLSAAHPASSSPIRAPILVRAIGRGAAIR